MQLPNLTCFMCLGKATIVIVTARFIQAASHARVPLLGIFDVIEGSTNSSN
jgi:hypothetical protein